MFYLYCHGVTISIVVGDNGILQRAKSSQEVSNDEKMKEQIKLAYTSYQMAKAENIEIDAKNYITKELENTYGAENVKVWSINGKNTPIIRVDIFEKNSYIMYDGKVEKNETFKNENGTEHRKYEVYKATSNPGRKYQDCDKMIALEFPNYVMIYPSAYATYMFSGCTNLEAIKLPLGKTTGHYVFTNLPSLEYLELGSVGHEWQGGGYFMAGGYYSGYTSRSFGTPVGLVIVAYMSSYNSTGRIWPWCAIC